MHNIIQCASYTLLIPGIIAGGAEVLFLFLAGFLILAVPEDRNWNTFKLCFIGGLMVGAYVGVLSGVIGAIESLNDKTSFVYHKSTATFIVLGLVFAALSVWATREFSRLLQFNPPKQPTPPDDGVTLAEVTVLQVHRLREENRQKAA